MKLIQTPSLITGAILGASLITLSAASNDSALGGLHVFVPGTTVSSADVNDNFTMVVDEVSALEGRVNNLEGSSSSEEYISGHHAPASSGRFGVLLSDSMGYYVPAGKQIRLTSVLGNVNYFYLHVVRANGDSLLLGYSQDYTILNFNTGFILHEGDSFELDCGTPSQNYSWCGILEDA